MSHGDLLSIIYGILHAIELEWKSYALRFRYPNTIVLDQQQRILTFGHVFFLILQVPFCGQLIARAVVTPTTLSRR